jgi:translocation and assembly module TamB
VAAKFRADGGSIKSSLSIVLAAGAANADLTFTPKTKAYSLRFDAPAMALQKLNFVQAKNLRLSGTVSASIMGAGTLENPQLNAVVELPELTARDKSISRIKAQLEIADHKAGFDLNSEVLDSSVHAHGQIDLTGDYYTEAAIDTTSVQLGVLLGTYSSNIPGDFRGQTEFHATLKGPLKNRSQMVAHLTIPVLNATYSSLQIGTAGPVQIDYAHSVITIQPTEIRGTGTSLHLEGSIPLGGNSAASITAKGTIDVSLARLFLPDTKSSGDISLDIQASGTASNPNVNGQIHLKDVAMFQAGAPLGVEKLNGTIDIDNERIHLTALSGQVGGGELSAGGSIAYRPSVQFNLALNAKSVRLRYPQGLRSLLDGNLAFTGTRDSSVLNGRVSIDSLSFTPDFDLSKFVDQFSTNTATLAQPGFADNIRLSIALHSQEDLSASSSQISIEGRVNLRVIGSASNPVITGRTDLTSGELFYRNTRYQLQRGIITFDDPNQTSPILDVSVTSMVEQYNLTLKLRGPFDKLTTSYVSDPPLATADIINLLATGQTTSESAASQSTDSIIASQAASEVTGGVQKLTGFSSLAIDPLIGGSNQSASARIALQQRVTKNFLFTFSTDVSQPGSEIVEGNYQINKRWSVSVARDEAGGVSTEGRLHTRF